MNHEIRELVEVVDVNPPAFCISSSARVMVRVAGTAVSTHNAFARDTPHCPSHCTASGIQSVADCEQSFQLCRPSRVSIALDGSGIFQNPLVQHDHQMTVLLCNTCRTNAFFCPIRRCTSISSSVPHTTINRKVRTFAPEFSNETHTPPITASPPSYEGRGCSTAIFLDDRRTLDCCEARGETTESPVAVPEPLKINEDVSHGRKFVPPSPASLPPTPTAKSVWVWPSKDEHGHRVGTGRPITGRCRRKSKRKSVVATTAHWKKKLDGDHVSGKTPLTIIVSAPFSSTSRCVLVCVLFVCL